MAYPAYIREKARELRTERQMTLDEIVERLGLPKTTVFGWIRDIPIERKPATTWPDTARQAAAAANRKRFAKLREAAYEEGLARFPALCAEATFRDFVTLFIAEGSKRNRNLVAIANSDPAVMKVAADWMRRESARFIEYSIQYHADQDLEDLRVYWGSHLSIDGASIKMLRKSNSNQLKARTWRSSHGVITARTNDTYFRARLQAWVDCLRRQWLDSPDTGRSAAW